MSYHHARRGKTQENKNAVIKNGHPELDSGSTPLVAMENKEEMLKQVQHDNRGVLTGKIPNLTTACGFTLIELLVVVLIIAILAAVAVPQYKKTVIKSRYATLKNLAHSIAQAQEVYYLANGKYTTQFSQLDIEMPGGKLGTSTSGQYKYDWGDCRITDVQVFCTNSRISMQYQLYLTHVSNSNTRNCVSFVVNMNDVRNQICKAETGATNGSPFPDWVVWMYKK